MTDARPVREKPIDFKGWEVKATLEGRKSQTRRLLKPQPEIRDGNDSIWMGPPFGPNAYSGVYPDGLKVVSSVKYAPGDRLWVRENYAHGWPMNPGDVLPPDPRNGQVAITYRADGNVPFGGSGKWRSCIHMPRWASRITLEVTEVRVQRVQDISEEDAEAEGAPSCVTDGEGKFYCFDMPNRGTHKCGFAGLWSSIHGPGSWDANPWCCCISFERVQ